MTDVPCASLAGLLEITLAVLSNLDANPGTPFRFILSRRSRSAGAQDGASKTSHAQQSVCLEDNLGARGPLRQCEKPATCNWLPSRLPIACQSAGKIVNVRKDENAIATQWQGLLHCDSSYRAPEPALQVGSASGVPKSGVSESAVFGKSMLANSQWRRSGNDPAQNKKARHAAGL